MSKLEALINEKHILAEMSDEDYALQNYAQYIFDTYSFIPIVLSAYEFDVAQLTRTLSLSLITQSIIIYSIAVY